MPYRTAPDSLGGIENDRTYPPPEANREAQKFADLLESGERSSRRHAVQGSTVRRQISNVRAEGNA